jgi:hypothetical protein
LDDNGDHTIGRLVNNMNSRNEMDETIFNPKKRLDFDQEASEDENSAPFQGSTIVHD